MERMRNMKISLLEPIGVSRETIDALAAPLIEERP